MAKKISAEAEIKTLSYEEVKKIKDLYNTLPQDIENYIVKGPKNQATLNSDLLSNCWALVMSVPRLAKTIEALGRKEKTLVSDN